MINTHDYAMELRQEARRSKERVRQLLAIQIEAQIEAQLDEQHGKKDVEDVRVCCAATSYHFEAPRCEGIHA